MIEPRQNGSVFPVAPANFTSKASGEIAGSATAAVCPTLACLMVKFRAAYSNAGNVYLGFAGVTKPDGSTDTTTGWELGPGDETGWLPCSNLNEFYRICDNAGDDLVYLAFA